MSSPASEPSRQPSAEPSQRPDTFEVDLSETLSGMHGMRKPPVPAAPNQTAPELAARKDEGPPDLESVFEQMRTRASRDEQVAAGATLFERAQEHLRMGRAAEAAADLQAAARVPQMRFKASAQLGRLSASRGDFRGAVEWLERAAEAPSTSGEESYGVLYDLADALERMGESARALAVWIELAADAAAYRDVQERIELLTLRQTQGHPERNRGATGHRAGDRS
jgi:tetratricopeptide (TPR) repeat protein